MADAAGWKPVTAQAVRANPTWATYCIPPVNEQTHGPHQRAGGYPISQPSDNQFLVNTESRTQFYALTAVTGDQFNPASDPFNHQPTLQNVPLPIGTTIVKEKYDKFEDAQRRINANAIAVMTKRAPGYAPERGDWEYGYIEIDAKGGIRDVTRGPIATCVDCHANRAGSDFVFRSYTLAPIE